MRITTIPGRVLPALLVAASLLLAACGGSGATQAPIGSGPTPATIDTPASAAAAIQAKFPLFDGIGPLDPNVIGASQWWESKPLDAGSPPAGWSITFVVGWGDCQAGCIDRHSWKWDVARDGRLTFVAEQGSLLTEAILAGRTGAITGTGVSGRATAGPTCPVERPGDPACAPRMVTGAVLILSRTGDSTEVARLTTDGSGLFRLNVEPGDYTLTAQPVEGFMGTPASIAVTVPAGGVAWLEVMYDTGIR